MTETLLMYTTFTFMESKLMNAVINIQGEIGLFCAGP